MSSSENSTVSITTPAPSTMNINDFIAYTCLGGLSVPINVITFAVILSDRSLRKRSALIAGLTLGNLFLGLHLLTNGVYRLVLQDDLQAPATYDYCLYIAISLIYPLAFNTEASFLILGGLERLLAIKAPNWFRKNWTHKTSWYITAGTVFLVFGILIINLVVPVPDRAPVTKNCGVTTMYGKNYVLFLSGYSAFGGTVSATLTAMALIFGLRHIKNLPLASGEAGRVRRQIQLTKSMVTVSCIDVALVVIPNLLSLSANLGVQFPTWVRASNSTYTHGANATVAFFAFLSFSSQFRKASIKLFHAQKLAEAVAKIFGCNITTVHPIAAQSFVSNVVALRTIKIRGYGKENDDNSVT